MTPEYASPEQVRGDQITTATDIYQLGLLLYVLLTGREPYPVRGRTPIEAFRVICESEPVPPSTAIGSTEADDDARAQLIEGISATRGTSPTRLRRSLQNDLDAILLKALRKEPAQRYTSIEWFIDDIRRHQHGLTVSAYHGVWAYRAAKFLRRHATVLAVAGIASFRRRLVDDVVHGPAREREKSSPARSSERHSSRGLPGQRVSRVPVTHRERQHDSTRVARSGRRTHRDRARRST